MARRADVVLLLMLLCPSLVLGQSLAEVARKEEERRKKNKETGVKAKVITEEDLSRGKVPAAKDGSSGSGAAATAAAAKDGAAAPPAAEPERVLPAGESDQQAQERQWRERAAAARAQVTQAEIVVAEMDKLSLVPGEYYVDSEGNTVIRDLAQLREMVAKAKADLAQAKQAVEDLHEEARRAGALPGWLR